MHREAGRVPTPSSSRFRKGHRGRRRDDCRTETKMGWPCPAEKQMSDMSRNSATLDRRTSLVPFAKNARIAGPLLDGRRHERLVTRPATIERKRGQVSSLRDSTPSLTKNQMMTMAGLASGSSAAHRHGGRVGLARTNTSMSPSPNYS